jgi:hypothetical protein
MRAAVILDLAEIGEGQSRIPPRQVLSRRGLQGVGGKKTAAGPSSPESKLFGITAKARRDWRRQLWKAWSTWSAGARPLFHRPERFDRSADHSSQSTQYLRIDMVVATFISNRAKDAAAMANLCSANDELVSPGGKLITAHDASDLLPEHSGIKLLS